MSIEEKQQFLCQQIIDGNYSPEEFQVFLEGYKPQAGADITQWSLEELKQAVKLFKKKHKPVGQVVPAPPVPPPAMPQKQPSSTESKKEDKSPEKPIQSQQAAKAPRGQDDEIDSIDPISGEDVYVKVLPCFKSDGTIFQTPPTVIMRKFEKNEGGIFQQDYVSYCVETPEHNWTVSRRYSQFMWLRETLEKLFPGLPVPPIPKKGHFRNFQQSHLHRRMSSLQNFLNKILAMPQLGSIGIVLGFIKISDMGEYMRYKKDFSVEQTRIPFAKLKSSKGTVRLAIEPKMTKMYTQFKQTFAVSQQKLSKIYKDSKAIFASMEQSAKLTEGLSTTFMELSEESARFLKATQIATDKTKGADLYRVISSLTRDASKLMMEQAQAYKQNIYSLYKYEMHHLIAINETLKRVQQAKEQYNQFKQKLRRTKDKLIQDKNYSKWGLSIVQLQRLNKDKNAYTRDQMLAMMLPKDSQQQSQLRDYYALINGTFYDEIIRYTRQNPSYLTRKLLELSKKQSGVCSAQMMLWADILTYFKHEPGRLYKISPQEKTAK